MSELAKWLRARLRNAWAWPVVFQIGCWWEKRYRPERWQGERIEGAILLPSGRATRRRPGESWSEAMNRLAEEDHPDYPKGQP